MHRYTVGCVPYINAIPLVHRFEREGAASPVRVVYDVPSRLPKLLETGEADAILVSSVDALRVPGRRMADGVCIGSEGPVESVRLFSRVPPSKIESLALDASSMTSNRLAQVVLRQRHGARPKTVVMPPDLSSMLDRCDAGVLIGDLGMTADASGLYVLDLGAEWTSLTGKPFVWAAWIGGDRLTPELAGLLAEVSLDELDAMVELAIGRTGLPAATVRRYLSETMVYRLDARMLEGFAEFRRRLLEDGFEDCRHSPQLVGPASRPALQVQ